MARMKINQALDILSNLSACKEAPEYFKQAVKTIRANIKEARPTVVQQRKAAICQRCGGSGYFRIFSYPTACFYLCSCEAGKRAAIAIA